MNIENPTKHSWNPLNVVIAIIVLISAVGLVATITFLGGKTPFERLISDVHKEHYEGLSVSVVENNNTPKHIVVSSGDNTNHNRGVLVVAQDLFCPHCADLHNVVEPQILNMIRDNSIELHIKLSTLTDGERNTDSMMASNAVLAAAHHNDAVTALSLQSAIMHNQSVLRTSDATDFYVDVAEHAGADKMLQRDIRNLSFQEDVEHFDQSTTLFLLEQNNKRVGVPAMFFNNKPVPLEQLENTKLKELIETL